MKTAAAMRYLALLTLLVAGCGQVKPLGEVASDSRSGIPTATPPVVANPSIVSCSGANPCLAIVTLLGSDQIVIRDVTDIAHAKTVGTVDHLSWTEASGRVVRVDWGQEASAPMFRRGSLVTFAVAPDMFGVPVGGSADRIGSPYPGIQQFDWSPDGSAIVFVHGYPSATSSTDIAFLGKPESPSPSYQKMGSLPALGAGSDDFRLLFSPDGTQISLVANGPAASAFRIWSAGGGLLKTDDGRGWTMSVWSGDGLYFRGSQGISVLRGGSISTFLPGVPWIKPSASPGGGLIAYSASDADGWSHAYVVDTTTGKIRELNKARTRAVFLTSRFIWYVGERECAPADQCGPNPPIHPLSGKTYIYDLQDGTETESVITNVFDVWPHAA